MDDDRNRFEPYIQRAVADGILTGCNPPKNDRFCPDRPVTRGELAVMLVRAIDAPSGQGDHYSDDNGHLAEGAIEALAAKGVTRGCAKERFCPDRVISRGEMAELLIRALAWETEADTSPYVDLDESPHGVSLAELARRGGVEPCDEPVGARLCPRAAVTRAEATFSLVTALGLSPAKASSTESEAPNIGFIDHFDSLNLWDGRARSNRNRVRITSEGYRGSGLRVTIAKGSHFGTDFKLDLSEAVGEDPELLYFRYMLRFDPDWATNTSGKLPGFSGVYGSTGKGGYRSSPSSPGWSARVQFFPNTADDPRVRLGYYVYHLGQQTDYGDGMAWGEAGRLVPGDWYCVEGEVRLNTPGLGDGALRAWIDGTSVFDVSGFAFRRPGEPDIRVNSFWFDTYYGGKTVPDKDLGLTIDEVEVDSQRIGCDSGTGTARPISGDFDGNGYQDRLTWGTCPGSDCFRLVETMGSGKRRASWLGNGAWFTLETHRVGMASGDFDGDDIDELVYPGRCAGSIKCWRVHDSTGVGWSRGEDWASGARFSETAGTLVAGDFDGDSLDDLTYEGRCGSDRHPCWRVHRSGRDHFLEPADWGAPHIGGIDSPVAADVTGDGLEELLYRTACGEETCWVAQVSTGSGFDEPLVLGTALDSELAWSELFDWNGDERADIISLVVTDENSKILVRRIEGGEVGEADEVVVLDAAVTDVAMRRVGDDGPTQAMVTMECGESQCQQLLTVALGKIISSERLTVESLKAPEPSICEARHAHDLCVDVITPKPQTWPLPLSGLLLR